MVALILVIGRRRNLEGVVGVRWVGVWDVGGGVLLILCATDVKVLEEII